MSFPRIEGYVVTEKIGSGSYSTVYKAYNKVGGRQTVAVKCVDKSRVKHSGSAVDNLVTEIRLLKTLDHPHIVRMHHFTWDDKNIYIIMEYCSGGDLSRYIKKYGRVPETQVRYFLQQLASALKFLYEKGVVHMDLKPHNLLLQKRSDGRLTLKVADFGFAQHLVGGWSGGVRGSPLYMAPEMAAGSGGPTVDLWSVGVIMYECLFGSAPYSSANLQELLDKIHRKEQIQIPANASISPGCRELLHSLLQHDPARRLTHEQFFAHDYLDLEHMPSAENYEKAVSLIKRAVSLDASGDLKRAFHAYTESLRYLVPCVSCETDAVRRAALKAKLTRYMERAEELKQYLKEGRTSRVVVPPTDGQTATSSDQPAAPPAVCEVCGAGADSCSCPRQEGAREEVAGHLEMSHTHHHEPTPVPVSCASRPTAGEKERDAATRRFSFRRLFSLHNPLPLLEHNDYSISTDAQTQNRSEKESDNDACKIT